MLLVPLDLVDFNLLKDCLLKLYSHDQTIKSLQDLVDSFINNNSNFSSLLFHTIKLMPEEDQIIIYTPILKVANSVNIIICERCTRKYILQKK